VPENFSGARPPVFGELTQLLGKLHPRSSGTTGADAVAEVVAPFCAQPVSASKTTAAFQCWPTLCQAAHRASRRECHGGTWHASMRR